MKQSPAGLVLLLLLAWVLISTAMDWMPLPVKILCGIAGAIIGTAAFLQAIGYLYDKYKEFGPGVITAASQAWIESPWKTTFMVAIVVGLLCALCGGVTFYTWAQMRSPTLSDKKEVPTQTDVSKPYSQMTNAELRVAAEQFVERLRRFISESERVDREEREKENEAFGKIPPGPEMEQERSRVWVLNSERMTRRLLQHNESFKNNFMVDARVLDEALRRKVDPVALVSPTRRFPSIHDKALDGSWIAPFSLNSLAEHLETLYRHLPAEDSKQP